jgi:hypothetical protein
MHCGASDREALVAKVLKWFAVFVTLGALAALLAIH